MRPADRLPDFPWDTIAAARRTAAAHPAGIVDLSVGTPVDPTPQLVRTALESASQAPGYPTVWGTEALHEAITGYLASRWSTGRLSPEELLPTIGSKEFIAQLPTQLGLGPQDLVVIPTIAYPTYQVGALMAGCRVQFCDDPDQVQGRPALIWINSPANPHGAIAGPDLLRRWVAAAGQAGAVLASDECYGEFGWTSQPQSILSTGICGGEHTGLIAVHSLSKRSNMAGYRAAYIAGDRRIVTDLLALRKHLGAMLPAPVQAAMAAALGDQQHVDEQRRRYLDRRTRLLPALQRAGFRIDHSEGSLYLWATREESGRRSLDWLAERGILVAPGDFYGPAGEQHVRIALTATDERIEQAADRLEG